MGAAATGKLKITLWLGLLAALVILLAFVAALIGPFAISPGQVVQAVGRKLAGQRLGSAGVSNEVRTRRLDVLANDVDVIPVRALTLKCTARHAHD